MGMTAQHLQRRRVDVPYASMPAPGTYLRDGHDDVALQWIAVSTELAAQHEHRDDVRQHDAHADQDARHIAAEEKDGDRDKPADAQRHVDAAEAAAVDAALITAGGRGVVV